jgi:hypothetical protein
MVIREEKIYEENPLYTDVIRDQILNPSVNSGWVIASDPFQYTIDFLTPVNIIISGYYWSAEQALQALDKVSDEVGITHELAEGELAEDINE